MIHYNVYNIMNSQIRKITLAIREHPNGAPALVASSVKPIKQTNDFINGV